MIQTLLGNRIAVIRKLAIQPDVKDLVDKHAPKAPFSVNEVLMQRKELILNYEAQGLTQELLTKRSIAFLLGV